MDLKLNRTSYILIALCFVMIGTIIFMCEPRNVYPKSTFASSSDMNNTLIFYADWCPACQSHIPDFKEAARQSNGKIEVHEADQPGTKELMQKLGVNSFPTIVKSNGDKHTGGRDINSIIDFANT